MKKYYYAITAIALAVVCFAFWGNLKDDFEPILITKAGKYSIDKSADIQVFCDRNNLLNIKYSIDGLEQECAEGFIEPRAEWFLYVHKRDEIWLVEKEDVTFIFDFGKVSGSYSLFNCHDGNVLNDFIYERAPKQLVEMLPMQIIERIEEAKRSGNILKVDESFLAAAPRIQGSNQPAHTTSDMPLVP